MAANINRLMGAGTILMGSDESFRTGWLATGILPIDYLLDGGLPRGRITEFFGDFSSLKSLIALRAIARCQDEGGVAMLVDTEHSFDLDWAAANGVNNDELLLSQPELGEQAVDELQIAIENKADLVVWDSIAATQPRQESEVQMSGEKNIQPARLAALMSVGIRRLNASNRQTAILCINQTRSKVGVMFGSPETTPGGKALPFFASYRVRLSRAGKISASTSKRWDGDKYVTVKQTTGQKVRAELVKSKLSRPDNEVYFVWDTSAGDVDDLGFLAATALELEIFPVATRGPKAAREYLTTHPKTAAKLRERIMYFDVGSEE